jgi:hypothetical protein
MDRPFRTKVELEVHLIEGAKCWTSPEFMLFDTWIRRTNCWTYTKSLSSALNPGKAAIVVRRG